MKLTHDMATGFMLGILIGAVILLIVVAYVFQPAQVGRIQVASGKWECQQVEQFNKPAEWQCKESKQ